MHTLAILMETPLYPCITDPALAGARVLLPLHDQFTPANRSSKSGAGGQTPRVSRKEDNKSGQHIVWQAIGTILKNLFSHIKILLLPHSLSCL